VFLHEHAHIFGYDGSRVSRMHLRIAGDGGAGTPELDQARRSGTARELVAKERAETNPAQGVTSLEAELGSMNEAQLRNLIKRLPQHSQTRVKPSDECDVRSCGCNLGNWRSQTILNEILMKILTSATAAGRRTIFYNACALRASAP